jgi:HSP20 family protein
MEEEAHMNVELWRPFGASMDRWGNASDIQGEVNRLFDNFFGRSTAAGTANRSWAPVVDLYETKDDLVLAMELPGVSDKDVTVSITGDLLSLKGERRFEHDVKEQQLLHVERAYGKFERLVQLPIPVQADKVKASYRDGVLEVRLPKTEEIKPKEIKVDIL